MSTPTKDIIIQLVINTGGGTLHPISDDYRLDAGMIWTCGVFLLPIELLRNQPAGEAARLIESALELSKVYDAPKTVAFLRNLLADCEDNPGAVVSVIEAA